jgi:hypothetical protein
MKEKIFAIVFRTFLENGKKVEEYIDSVGATVIFVKQADVNRKLVVKNLPAWEEEKDESTNSA